MSEDNQEWVIPNDPNVSPDDIEPGADLFDVNLSKAKLEGANLSRANLRNATLVDANLSGADLSNAHLIDSDAWGIDLSNSDLTNADLKRARINNSNLKEADLPGANLRMADLSESSLDSSDISGADLFRANCNRTDFANADLSDANLTGAVLSAALLPETDFSGASVAEISLDGVKISRGTAFDQPANQITIDEDEDSDLDKSKKYGIIARVNHELKNAYSNNGLVERARDARFRERKARRKEAHAAGGIRGYITFLESIISMVVTGYGVRLRWIFATMLAIYISSSYFYIVQGMSVYEGLYYSIITFTTSPPWSPPSGISSAVAGIETIVGTTAIIFLGYVLGTRERV
jgi:uncharacterized protein YjbI with pentapeptide repeats